MPIDLSIVIPAYNRADILKYTLESVHYAIADLNIEIIVVDDGSKEPLSEQLQDFLNLPIRFIRQVNQGSIVARNRGLREAIGDYVLFLDSDDLVHPDKLSAQVRCLNQTNAEVCYTDEAIAQLKGDYASLVFQPNRVLSSASRAAEFYLKIQPLPCNPIYKRSYLQQHLATPMISENRIFDPVGDVWLYYNLAAYPAKVVKLDQYYSVYGEHDQDRYTDHWEMLGVASLALMLTFIKNVLLRTQRWKRVDWQENALLSPGVNYLGISIDCLSVRCLKSGNALLGEIWGT